MQERIPYSKRGGESGSRAGDRDERVPRGCKVFIRFTISSITIKRGNTLMPNNEGNQMVSTCSSPSIVDTFLGRVNLSY